MFQLSQFGLIGMSSLMMFVVPLSDAVAQFPGVGREAPSGVATQASDGGYNSVSANDDNSKNDDNPSVESRTETASASDDNASAEQQSFEADIVIENLEKKKQRKQLFIKAF